MRARAAYAPGVLGDVSAVAGLARRLPYESAPNRTVFVWALGRLAEATCTTSEERIQQEAAREALHRCARAEQVATSSPAIDPAEIAAEQMAETAFEVSEALADLFMGTD